MSRRREEEPDLFSQPTGYDVHGQAEEAPPSSGAPDPLAHLDHIIRRARRLEATLDSALELVRSLRA